MQGAICSILDASYPQISRLKEGRKLFWRKELDDVNPCRFPNLSPLRMSTGQMKSITFKSASGVASIQKNCRSQGFTIHAVGQAAWARILAAYTGERIVTFGTVLSGRDGFTDAEDVAFPCLTTVATVAYCNGSDHDLVESFMNFNIRVRKHQFTPLSRIQRPNEPLFDTIFALQKILSPLDHQLKLVPRSLNRRGMPFAYEKMI